MPSLSPTSYAWTTFGWWSIPRILASAANIRMNSGSSQLAGQDPLDHHRSLEAARPGVSGLEHLGLPADAQRLDQPVPAELTERRLARRVGDDAARRDEARIDVPAPLTDSAADDAEQVGHLDGFRDVAGRVQLAADRGHVGAGRHQEHRDVGEGGRLPLLATEIPAVHDRHQEVEEDQIAAPLVVAELPSASAVGGAQRVVAGILQDGRDRIEGVGIVFDDQHDLAGAGGPGEIPVRETRRFDVRHRLKVVVPLSETRRSIIFGDEDKKSGIPLDIPHGAPSFRAHAEGFGCRRRAGSLLPDRRYADR